MYLPTALIPSPIIQIMWSLAISLCIARCLHSLILLEFPPAGVLAQWGSRSQARTYANSVCYILIPLFDCLNQDCEPIRHFSSSPYHCVDSSMNPAEFRVIPKDLSSEEVRKKIQIAASRHGIGVDIERLGLSELKFSNISDICSPELISTLLGVIDEGNNLIHGDPPVRISLPWGLHAKIGIKNQFYSLN